MAYTINRFNGTVLTSVEDGTVDQTTDLKLIGKNYSGYGEAQNENFLFLLENFSGTAAPTKPITGQLWFDNSGNRLKVYDGTQWKGTGGAEVAAATPTSRAEGDLWWNTTTDQLYGLNESNTWVLIGPQKAGTGTTSMQSFTIFEDSTGVAKSVIAAVTNNKIVSIISPNNDFVPAVNTLQTEIPAEIKTATGELKTAGVFPTIKKGITLFGAASDGNTYTSDHYFWGTAAAANGLVDGSGVYHAENEYVKTASLDFRSGATAAQFPDQGFTVGTDNADITMRIRQAGDPSGDGVTGDTPVLELDHNMLEFLSSGASTTIATLTNTHFYPFGNSTYTLGKSSNKFLNVHATTFTGQATAADTLSVGGTNRSAATAATPNTIAARDGSGNITANVFTGTATKARYADLAEKYTVEEGVEHPVGTVMMVGKNSKFEIEPYQLGGVAVGVISEKPAYLMNEDCDGQPIALKGRVPVKVVFPVGKGQKLYGWSDGTASTIPTDTVVGVALESNTAQEEKLVEVLLQV